MYTLFMNYKHNIIIFYIDLNIHHHSLYFHHHILFLVKRHLHIFIHMFELLKFLYNLYHIFNYQFLHNLNHIMVIYNYINHICKLFQLKFYFVDVYMKYTQKQLDQYKIYKVVNNFSSIKYQLQDKFPFDKNIYQNKM